MLTSQLYVNKSIKYPYINKMITKHTYIQDNFFYISQFIYVIKIIEYTYIYITDKILITIVYIHFIILYYI